MESGTIPRTPGGAENGCCEGEGGEDRSSLAPQHAASARRWMGCSPSSRIPGLQAPSPMGGL